MAYNNQLIIIKGKPWQTQVESRSEATSNGRLVAVEEWVVMLGNWRIGSDWDDRRDVATAVMD